MKVVLAQERLNEFVVEVDETHNPIAIYANYGATPNDGVVIINSTIPDLEFGIMSVAKERLRKVVPDKGKNRYLLIIQPNDSNYKHYTITMNAKGFKQGKIEPVIVKAGLSTGYIVNSKDTNGLLLNNKIGGHEYVDLGLPSGTLWATCNVGASNPEDYGDYFAWGETSPKSTYNWESYTYAMGTTWHNPQLTKYCSKTIYGYYHITDNLTELQTIDDAAAANWGSSWRTPSKAQWEELLANTTTQWTMHNGKIGRLFTSKKNEKSIFVPAAGERDSDSPIHTAFPVGHYWSRSLDTDYPHSAWNLNFGAGGCNMYKFYRDTGFSVRPVYSSQK